MAAVGAVSSQDLPFRDRGVWFGKGARPGNLVEAAGDTVSVPSVTRP
jgi:hypothetical protein